MLVSHDVQDANDIQDQLMIENKMGCPSKKVLNSEDASHMYMQALSQKRAFYL